MNTGGAGLGPRGYPRPRWLLLGGAGSCPLCPPLRCHLRVRRLLELHEVHREAAARARQRPPVGLGQPTVAGEVESLELRRAALLDGLGERLPAVALNGVAVEEELLEALGRVQLLRVPGVLTLGPQFPGRRGGKRTGSHRDHGQTTELAII